MSLSSKSAQMFERAQKIMPGGCSRNTVLRKPHPEYAASANGCYVTDIEGVKRVDFANNMASLIHGHCQPEVTQAVTQQLQLGSAFTLATEQEIEYAELLCSRNVSFEKLRFVNSGTEAVMSCIKAARAFTGHSKIVKVEGAYHGLYDYAEVSQTAHPENWGDENNPSSVPVAFGTPQSALNEVVVIPFNDIERAQAILQQHENDIACVLLDFIPHRTGLIAATDEFVSMLYSWTRANNALLVADEVITFRTLHGGAQQAYTAKPDLTALGKMIGGGFPVGALAGRADVMDVMNPLNERLLFPHSGTFSANPITMTAGYHAMCLFDEAAVTKLNKLGDYARQKMSHAITESGVEACVTGEGSMLRLHLSKTAPKNYRDCFLSNNKRKQLNQLLDYWFDHGFIIINTGTAMLSTAMTEAHIDALVETTLAGLKQLNPS